MYGKKVKFVSNAYVFGAQDKYVNILLLFKYKKDNNYYLIYEDAGNLYWGSTHVNGDKAICIQSKIDGEFIKDICNKLMNNIIIDYIDVYPTSNLNSLEIISSSAVIVNVDVQQLVKMYVFSSQNNNYVQEEEPKSKGNFTIILLIIGIGIMAYLNFGSSKHEVIVNSMKCVMNTDIRNINANANYEDIYYYHDGIFNRVEKKIIFKFKDSKSFDSFIRDGILYKYVDDDVNDYITDSDHFSYEFKEVVNELEDYQDYPMNELKISIEKKGYSCS